MGSDNPSTSIVGVVYSAWAKVTTGMVFGESQGEGSIALGVYSLSFVFDPQYYLGSVPHTRGAHLPDSVIAIVPRVSPSHPWGALDWNIVPVARRQSALAPVGRTSDASTDFRGSDSAPAPVGTTAKVLQSPLRR